MGGVRLGGDIAECHQSSGRAEPWIGVALIAIETEVHGTSRLAYHHDVDLAGVLGMRCLSLEAEVGRSILVVDGCVVALHSKIEVIEGIDGVEVIEHAILCGMMVVELCVVGGMGEICRGNKDAPHDGQGRSPLAIALSEGCTQHRGLLTTYGHHAQDEQWQIEDEDTCHTRDKVVEQFHRLARIGGYEVEKHIHGNNALAEEIEQYNLKSRKEDDEEEPPYHFAWLATNAHQGHVDGKGQHDVGKCSPSAEVLAETKCHIGHGKRYDGIPIYKFVE